MTRNARLGAVDAVRMLISGPQLFKQILDHFTLIKMGEELPGNEFACVASGYIMATVVISRFSEPPLEDPEMKSGYD